MTSSVAFTITEMLRQTSTVLNAVEQSSEVLLRRRDGADVLLVEASRERAMRHSLHTAAVIASAAIESSIEVVSEHIVDRLPWIHYLPSEQRIEFLRKFAHEAADAAETHQFARLAQLERDWETSALLYTTPGVREWLTRAAVACDGLRE